MRTPRLYSVGQHSHGIQPKTSELGGENAAYHWKTPRLLAVYAVATGDNSGIFLFRSATSTRRAFQRIRRFCSVYVIFAVYFTLDASMKLSFPRPWPFAIWLTLCVLGGVLGKWLFEVPFLYGTGVFAVALFLNGQLAEIEDNEPGGFNNPDGKSK